MSTAAEIMLMLDAAAPHMDKLRAMIDQEWNWLIEDNMVRFMGREVSAKRVRKIIRRGDLVRFSRYTTTGKRRYFWLRRINFDWNYPA